MQAREGIVLVFGLVALSQVWAAARDLDDSAHIQGVWNVTQGEENGKALPPEKVKGTQVLFTKDAVRLINNENKQVWLMRYTLDANARPAELAMTVVKGQDKGQTSLGIYALEGNTLRLCYALPGRERPETFTTAEGSGTLLFALTRNRQ